MRNTGNLLRRLAGVLLFVPFFVPSVHAQSSALEELLSAPGAVLPELAAPSPLLPAETFPEMEQDRKPAAQVSKAGGVRIINGVRFERDAASNTYAWRELKIEDAGLDEVYFGYRSGGVGHSFLLFTFKSGAESAGKAVSGLVVEALPWKKKGEEYSPFGGGITGKYALVWNMVAWDSFLETAVGRDGLYADVYPMKVSREEKLRLLDEAVSEAVRGHDGEKYHTFFNSCSSNALKVFSRATGHHLVIGKMLPSVVVEHLKLRGFLGERQRHEKI